MVRFAEIGTSVIPKFDPDVLRAGGDLAKGIASLAWPMVTLILALIYKSEIKALLARIKKFALFGAEVELEAQVEELEVKTAEAASSAYGAGSYGRGQYGGVGRDSRSDTDSILKEAEAVSSISPRAALVLLATGCEIEVRRLSRDSGFNPEQRFNFVMQMNYLQSREVLSTQVADALKSFWKVRNEVVHLGKTSDELVRRAVDAGLVILRILSDMLI